ncbi:MAG: 50S ribosomal protein L21 [Chloroflexi bacterium]|nr:50S ribosomal protein L21 [Chloroflexota bacterium]MCL5274037.1 50S ribosomal protein L21 [Chloroflexota bacterium]
MYAIVEVGGRQYRVAPGEKFLVEKLKKPAGASVELPVMLLSDETGISVGKPYIDGKTLSAMVLGEAKGEKLIVFKYTPKKRYRRKTGHRQTYTMLQVIDNTAAATASVEKTAQSEPATVEPSAEATTTAE